MKRWQIDRLAAAATILAGALLLFEVEPLIAKAILPWFGGSAQVWTTCLLFFQAALLAGYLYAHLLTTRVTPRWQGRIHAGLLVASLIFLPIIRELGALSSYSGAPAMTASGSQRAASRKCPTSPRSCWPSASTCRACV